VPEAEFPLVAPDWLLDDGDALDEGELELWSDCGMLDVLELEGEVLLLAPVELDGELLEPDWLLEADGAELDDGELWSDCGNVEELELEGEVALEFDWLLVL